VSEGPRTAQQATIIIRSPDSRVAHLRAIARRRIEPKDVAVMMSSAVLARPRVRPLFVTAAFLSPRTRELLSKAGASYLDATGNVRLALERPAIFVEAHGGDKDPAREPRPLASLKGPAAGRVVRALCDVRRPCGVRELAERCATPASTVSRVLGLLERNAIVIRGDRGQVREVDVPALIRRRTEDAEPLGSGTLHPTPVQGGRHRGLLARAAQALEKEGRALARTS
jgi:hypothetical protein